MEGAPAAPARAARWLERVYRRRGLLASPPLIAALLLPPPAGGPPAALLLPAGTALFLAGVGLRTWAQQHLPYRLGLAGRVVDSGPYARVRNPAYLGSLLVCSGAAACSGVPWAAPVTALWCAVVYAAAARFEGRHLARRFGEAYREYRRSVPGWVPRPAPGRPLALVTPRLSRAARVEARNLLVLAPFLAKALLV